MNTKELVKIFQDQDPNGEMEVVVPLAIGLGGPAARVASAGPGFDWYGDKMCLTCNPEVVSLLDYGYMADMADNSGHIIYCETEIDGKYAYGHDRYAYVCSRKPPLKIGQVVGIRKVGDKKGDKFKVVIIKHISTSILMFPHYFIKRVEEK